MQRPPRDPRTRRDRIDPSWQALLVSYAAMAAVPLLLWAWSRPLAGLAAVAIAVVAVAAARRTVELARCLSECGGFALDVTEGVRICVTRPNGAEPN